jgi:hypothetical protein
MSILYACPQNVSKKSQKIYTCCSATKCVIYYTHLKPLMENTMFEFEKQCKQFEEFVKNGYNFWVGVVADTLKLYKTK